MTRLLSPRYFLASIVLLLVVVALHVTWTTRRTQQELLRQFEEKGLALAEALETSSRSAVRADALMEEMIAQRLLDNARLVDQMLFFPPFDPAEVKRIAEMNRLRRVDLLDRSGQPYAFSPAPHPMAVPSGPVGPGGPGPGGMPGHRRMHGMMRGMPPPEAGSPDPRGQERPMRMYMWGRRWGAGGDDSDTVPPAVQDRKFWEGSVFGVAVGARSFPGIIAVHADADYVLNFRKTMGVERQMQDLARESGIESIALLDGTGHVLAHSGSPRLAESGSGDRADETAAGGPTRGQTSRGAEPTGPRGGGEAGSRGAPAKNGSGDGTGETVAAAMSDKRTMSRLVALPEGREVFEVLKPLDFAGAPGGVLRIRLATDSIERARRRERDAGLGLGLVVVGLGVVGLAAIFYAQGRQLRERRALEAEMARRERLATLGDMAATVAHEVRNPLNAVSMGLQRLRAEFEPAGADDYRRLVGLMQGEVTRINAIVEEFLSLARPLTLSPAIIDAGNLVRQVAALVEGQAKAAAVEIAVRGAEGLPALHADGDRLRQVLLNVMLNGIQAMPDGGTLAVEMRAAGSALYITVSDTGAGIPAEMRSRIFEPYVTTKTKGLGLGLAVARRIVEAHGGGIAAESAPGPGTRIVIELPLGAPA